MAADTGNQLQSTVAQINQLTGQIQQINQQIRGGNQGDAGLDAQLNTDLEQLSNLVGITVQYQSDGTATVLMGGQTPLVIGVTQNQLKVTNPEPVNPANPDAPLAAAIVMPDGKDVTSTVTNGTLAGELTFNNVTLAGVMGNSSTQGSLNQLAQAIADGVNGLLNQGTPPGGPLFSYDATRPTAIAQGLTVDTGATLTAASATSNNGTADALTQLLGANASAMPDGMSYSDSDSGVASDVGAQASAASTDQTTQTGLLTQAQNMRAQISGISLNDQAAQLIQFQQSYEAAAQTISVINNVLQDLITMMQGV